MLAEREFSESFAKREGMRQRCIMSSWLFNIFMGGCMRKMLVQNRLSEVDSNFIVACLQMTL